MNDADRQALVERVTFEPVLDVRAQTIPWPAGLAPTPDLSVGAGGIPPSVDVLVVTWTAAEAEALADVFTPGVNRSRWHPYTENWAAFEPQLTYRSPAKESKRLASYCLTRIGSLQVLAMKSELHLATDADTAPIVQLWQQLLHRTNARLVITTGTAGGIGADTALGDIAIATRAKFNCTKTFAGKPWAQASFTSSPVPAGPQLATAIRDLIPINAERLQPEATRPPKIWPGVDVETIDFFGFDDTADSYGVRHNDPHARTEEMDDATLGLAVQGTGWTGQWVSVRNASDPQVPSSIGTLEMQSRWASSIYQRYGYWTTIGSAITCWAIIADTLT